MSHLSTIQHPSPRLIPAGQAEPTGLGLLDPVVGQMGDRPMTNYREQLLDPRWQRMRLECLQAAEWRCAMCFAEKDTLHVHHQRYVKGLAPWEYDRSDLVVLCAKCHSGHHDMRTKLEALVAVGGPNWLRNIHDLVAGYLFAMNVIGDAPDLANESDAAPFYVGCLAAVVETEAYRTALVAERIDGVITNDANSLMARAHTEVRRFAASIRTFHDVVARDLERT